MTPYIIITQAARNCPFCEHAADLLDRQALPYRFRPLTRTELEVEAERANMSTIPIIYHGIKLIGGFQDLKAYLAGRS